MIFVDLLAMLRDPWAGVESWRQRRAAAVANPSKPTYDVYPDRDLPPTVKMYVEARDARGRLLREYVDLEGYSVHQLNWRNGARRGGMLVRDWFVGEVLAAMVRLSVRVDAEKERKDRE